MAPRSSREDHEDCPPTTSQPSLPLSLPLPLQFGSSLPGLFSGFLHLFARNTVSALSQLYAKSKDFIAHCTAPQQ